METPKSVVGARWIPLTRGMFALVDNRDYDSVAKFNWCAGASSKTTYAKRRMIVDGELIVFYLHRFIMEIYDKRQVDHRDGNGLDCRRHNLRVCDSQKNNMNRRKSQTHTSKFKGVSWDRSRDLWRATIKINRKIKYLGRFESESIAAEKYDSAARKLFGEFAVLNFP